MEQSKFRPHLNLVPVGLGLLLTASACTKSGGGNANVTFTLPAGITASSSGLHMMTAETSSALNCYFITVGGPEAPMSNNTCQDAGATVAPFNIGIIAGGFAQGSTGTLSVPAGQNRSFSVMGFSATGSCPSLASLMSSGSSTTVYFLGQTTGVNLSAGETAAVNITVPSQYDNVNNVVSCAGPLFPNGGGNSTPSQLAVVLQDSLSSATTYNSATCVPAFVVVQNSSGSGANVSSGQYSLLGSSVSGNISSPAYNSVFTDNACTSAWTTSTTSTYTNGNTQSLYIQTPAASTTGTISFGATGTPALNPVVSTFTTRSSNYGVNDIALVSSTLQNSKLVTIGSSTSIPAWQCEAMSAQIQDSLGVPTPANGTNYTLGGATASGVTYYTDQFCTTGATTSPSSSIISGTTASTAQTNYYFRITSSASPTWGFSGTGATFSNPTVTVTNSTSSPTTTALLMPNSGFSTPGTSLKIPAGTCQQVELAFVDSSGNRGSFKINSGGGGYYAYTSGIFFSNSSCSATYDLNTSNGLSSATGPATGFVTMWVKAPASGTTVTSQLAFCGNSGLTTTPSTGFMSSTALYTAIGGSTTACFGSPYFYEQANVPTFSITGQ